MAVAACDDRSNKAARGMNPRHAVTLLGNADLGHAGLDHWLAATRQRSADVWPLQHGVQSALRCRVAANQFNQGSRK